MKPVSLLSIGVAAAIALASVACDVRAESPPQVWLAPNLGSRDLLGLFTRPEQWSGARRFTDVFLFHEGQLLSDTPAQCPGCGPNLFPALTRARAFETLAGWGIDIAAGMGALKEWGCTADLTADRAREALWRVTSAGGRVRYLAMDEPLAGAEPCGLTRPEAVRQVAAFVREIKEADPKVQVGDIEPYPYYGAGLLIQWLSELEAAGARPDFFQLDVDRVHAARRRSNVARDLQTLEAWCRLRGIPFGVILWSPEVSSDRAFYQDTLAWSRAARAAVGTPSQWIVESWQESPGGGRHVPANLPEADPAAYTMTRLLLEVLRPQEPAVVRGR